MKIIRFVKMQIAVPMKDGETVEEIENRLIEGVDSIGEGVVMSWWTVVEDDDGKEELYMRQRTDRENELVELIAEYLDTEGTKQQLMKLVRKAIAYSDGDKLT